MTPKSLQSRLKIAKNAKFGSTETGKVYGLDNLRVIDASIMPDCVRACEHQLCGAHDRRADCRFYSRRDIESKLLVINPFWVHN
ncbi:GMC family oxidoreductase [Chloroflexi bacterium TSY]|nr:GMC family oxidoreductase [Chloroflexi bacterium TSY]